MSFISLSFILYYLPIAIFVYYLFPNRKIQNSFLLVISILFYTLGQTTGILLLLFLILWNWGAALLLGPTKKKSQNKKFILVLAIGMNILPLVLFRFTKFSYFNMIFGTIGLIMIPAGLAWYTLLGIGYCMDVYRGTIVAEKNPFTVALHISFLPTVLNGPLIPFENMKQQLNLRVHTTELFHGGICRFVIGLSKKILIADQLSYIVNYIFTQSFMDSSIVQMPVTLGWVGMIGLAMQLYFELSGYADMAIGIGMLFGFKVPENFNEPYMATSITDFWKRWNITVLAWFRHYLFGSFHKKENQDMVTLDLFITWIFFGLWLGFDWSFVFWGSWNFIFLLAEHFFGYMDKVKSTVLKRIYTLLHVMIGFVLLKSDTIFNAGQFFTDLLGFGNNSFYDARVSIFLKEYWLPIGAGLFITLFFPNWKRKISIEKNIQKAIYVLGVTLLFVFCIAAIIFGVPIWTPII